MKKIVVAALTAIMLASLSGCGKTAEKEADGEYIYGQVESVSGNDVVLLLADYNENAEEEKSDSESDNDKKEKSDGEEGESSKKRSRPSFGDMPEGFDTGNFDGKMPEGFDKGDFEGEMPEGFDKGDSEGKMPEGFDKGSFGDFKRPDGEKSDDGEKSENSDSKKRPSGSGSKYTLTGDKEEIRIPVGTKVTTSLGVETDFKVLSEGDIIRCSAEKNSSGEEVVTAVQIMEK